MFDIEAEKVKIVQLLEESVEAENRRNVDAAIEICDKDCYFLAPGMKMIKSQSDLREPYKTVLDSLVHMENEMIDVQFSENGDMAFLIASYHMVLKEPEGNVDEIGKFLWVLSKKSGEWKVVAVAYNTDD